MPVQTNSQKWAVPRPAFGSRIRSQKAVRKSRSPALRARVSPASPGWVVSS